MTRAGKLDYLSSTWNVMMRLYTRNGSAYKKQRDVLSFFWVTMISPVERSCWRWRTFASDYREYTQAVWTAGGKRSICLWLGGDTAEANKWGEYAELEPENNFYTLPDSSSSRDAATVSIYAVATPVNVHTCGSHHPLHLLLLTTESNGGQNSQNVLKHMHLHIYEE